MRAFLLLFVPVLSFSAILPETIGHWKRGEPAAAATPDPKVWAEYGLKDSETAPYSDAGEKYSISAWRFADSTGAMAAYFDLRPAAAKPAPLMGLASQTDTDDYVAAGNYLFHFIGYKIHGDELSHVVATVPKYEFSPLPTLPKYLPAGAQTNSERYIMGPASLARFAPAIPPSTASFHFSAEAAVATYGQPGRETTVAVFGYPALEMTRDLFPRFQQIPGVVAKRAGPIVAVVLKSPTPDDAERLLSKIKYEAAITVPEHPQTSQANAGTLFLNVFILCGVLIALCLVAGIIVGGLRMVLRRADASGDGDSMITLHIGGKP